MRAALWSVGVCDGVCVTHTHYRAHMWETLYAGPGRMKGRRWAGGKWRTKETHRLIYQIVSIAQRKRGRRGGEEESGMSREVDEERSFEEQKKKKTSCSSGREEAVNIEKRLQRFVHLVKQKKTEKKRNHSLGSGRLWHLQHL